MNRGVVWSAVEAAGSAVVSLGSAFVVARLIGPAELGIGAAAVAVNLLLWVAVNALFADAIVQRDVLGAETMGSAVLASTAVGVLSALVQAGAGWGLMHLLDDPRLVPMSLLLAIPMPLTGTAGPLQGWVTRNRRYDILAARTLLSQGGGMAAGIFLALHGAGAWAPVAQHTTVALVAACVLIAASGWRWHLAWRWAEVTRLLRIGVPLTASTLVQIGRYRVFALLIGGTAGPAALGQIHMAFRLVDACKDIVFTGLWRLMLPILSAHQHDRTAMAREADRLLWLSSLVTLPLCGGLAAVLVPLTGLVLGPGWHDAGVASVPLVGVMALLSLMFPSGVALVAVGQARLTLFANVAGLLATMGFVLAVRPASPWTAVMVWCAAQVFVSPYSLWANGRALGSGPVRPLAAGLPMLGVTAAGLLAASWMPAGTGIEGLAWRTGGFLAGLAIGAGAGGLARIALGRAGWTRRGAARGKR